MVEKHECPEAYRYSHTKHGWLILRVAMIQQETRLSKVTLSSILSEMNTFEAAQSSMVNQILTCALNVANQMHRAEKFLVISVKFIVAFSESENPLYINDDDEEYESDVDLKTTKKVMMMILSGFR